MIAAGSGLGAWIGTVGWLGGMILFGALLFRMRTWLTTPSTATGAQVWTLQDLRGMLSEGRITQVEYEALRAQLMGMAGKPSSSDDASEEPREEASEETNVDAAAEEADVNAIKPPDEVGR